MGESIADDPELRGWYVSDKGPFAPSGVGGPDVGDKLLRYM